VEFAPAKKRWHGASPAIDMTHITGVDGLEKVSDEQYTVIQI
jgi:hypothetical protein